MNDDEVARLADLVSDRVFAAMSKFVDALEAVARENEILRTEVDELKVELEMLAGDADGLIAFLEPVEPSAANNDDLDDDELVPANEIDSFLQLLGVRTR